MKVWVPPLSIRGTGQRAEKRVAAVASTEVRMVAEAVADEPTWRGRGSGPAAVICPCTHVCKETTWVRVRAAGDLWRLGFTMWSFGCRGGTETWQITWVLYDLVLGV